jgi:butyrate kinase
MLVQIGYASAQGFVYDDHGKRDPFVSLVSKSGMLVSYDADLAVNDLTLEGIVADTQGNNAANVAVVNGHVVRVGDHIGPYVVDVITLDHVEFLKGAQRFTLGLKKGGAALNKTN